MHFAPRPTADALAQLYRSGRYRDEARSAGETDVALSAHRRVMFERALRRHGKPPERGGRLLDVGCGRGDFLASLRAAGGWDIAGTELTASAAQQVATRVGCPVHAGDLVALGLPIGHFSVITMFHVAEHLLAPVTQFAEARRLLAPGGCLYLETPNLAGLGARLRGRRWSMIIPPEHLNYFTPHSLEAALRQAGFTQVSTWSISPPIAGSIAALPAPLRALGNLIYELAPALGLGAQLQALASCPEGNSR